MFIVLALRCQVMSGIVVLFEPVSLQTLGPPGELAYRERAELLS